jgi:hypothetical protein
VQASQKVGFVKWREASKNPAKARWIKWGKIKTPERAIEKAFRSYKVHPASSAARFLKLDLEETNAEMTCTSL